MTTAKLFKHGGSQAVRLPKAFRLPGIEVTVEKRGDTVVLRPMHEPRVKTLGDLARYMSEINPSGNFPDRGAQGRQERDLTW